MLRIGQEAPEFSLPGTAAGDVDTYGLREYTDHGWTVVLVFYPFDFHPDCTEQWCELREADWLTLLDDVVVLGIGGDGVFAHRAYADQHNLQFPLLSDADGRVSEAYGVLASEARERSSGERSESDGVLAEAFEGHRRVPGRATFVVDPGHRVQYAWRADGVGDEPNLMALKKATNCYGDVCELEPREGSDEPA